MLRKYISTIVIIISAIPCIAQVTPKEIITLSYQSLSIRKSINYHADCKYKFFDDDDTLTFSGNVQLLKNVSDSIFGGYVKYNYGDTMYIFYNLDKIYKVDDKNKKLTIYNPHKEEGWAMTGNVRHNIVLKSFLEPERMERLANEDGILTFLNDTIINGAECYTIQKVLPDEHGYSDHVITTCFNKKDKIPVYQARKIKFQDNYQYNTILISGYSFNTLTEKNYSIEQIPSKYKRDTFKQEEYKPLPLLAEGTAAPKITGQHYQENMRETTISYEGKITLLDYWYMACFPCISAIPVIEKLHEQYKDKGLQVYGINSIDHKWLSRMPKFLEKNPIQYPILMVDEKVPTAYNVTGWPAFYIIGKDGKVAFSTKGFSADVTEKELTEAIEKLLQ